MIYDVQGQSPGAWVSGGEAAIAVWLHISCKLQTMATLGMMYPARGGLVWGQMRECYLKSGGLYNTLGE